MTPKITKNDIMRAGEVVVTIDPRVRERIEKKLREALEKALEKALRDA
jgi:hypothetical protein